MPHRTFCDSHGRLWDVWSVTPTRIERRNTPTSVEFDRRERDEPRAVIDPGWSVGWLAFQTPGEKRRLANYPADWADLDAEALENLCTAAVAVQPSRRLIE